jgi:excisionase family DNA binding protein
VTTTTTTTTEPATPRLLMAEAQPPTPRLALSPAEAADALGVSVDFFDLHIRPELRVVRRGRRVLVPVEELRRWLRRSAALTLE